MYCYCCLGFSCGWLLWFTLWLGLLCVLFGLPCFVWMCLMPLLTVCLLFDVVSVWIVVLIFLFGLLVFGLLHGFCYLYLLLLLCCFNWLKRLLTVWVYVASLMCCVLVLLIVITYCVVLKLRFWFAVYFVMRWVLVFFYSLWVVRVPLVCGFVWLCAFAGVCVFMLSMLFAAGGCCLVIELFVAGVILVTWLYWFCIYS